jgi:hypothetical protein
MKENCFSSEFVKNLVELSNMGVWGIIEQMNKKGYTSGEEYSTKFLTNSLTKYSFPLNATR